jgi:hypothetical protein
LACGTPPTVGGLCRPARQIETGSNKSVIGLLAANKTVNIERKDSVEEEDRTTRGRYDLDKDNSRLEAGDE